MKLRWSFRAANDRSAQVALESSPVLAFLLLLKNEATGKRKYVLCSLHIAFLAISFVCIWTLFEYSF